jgi:hypothetical protein
MTPCQPRHRTSRRVGDHLQDPSRGVLRCTENGPSGQGSLRPIPRLSPPGDGVDDQVCSRLADTPALSAHVVGLLRSIAGSMNRCTNSRFHAEHRRPLETVKHGLIHCGPICIMEMPRETDQLLMGTRLQGQLQVLWQLFLFEAAYTIVFPVLRKSHSRSRILQVTACFVLDDADLGVPGAGPPHRATFLAAGHQVPLPAPVVEVSRAVLGQCDSTVYRIL